MSTVEEILISLIRRAIGTADTVDIPSDFDGWEELKELSFRQGVAYVAADGLVKVIEDDPSLTGGNGRRVILPWLANAERSEVEYARHRQVLPEMCRVLHDNGIEKILLLKGLGLSAYYPVPEHRPTGDLDIYTYGQGARVDEVFRSLGIDVDSKRSSKHSKCTFEGIPVENHNHYLENFRSGIESEINGFLPGLEGDILKEGGYYVPSPEKNFWFLACHMQSHFLSLESFTLRHLLDWALFLKGESARLDTLQLMEKARSFNLETFISYMTALAERVSGLDLRAFVTTETDPGTENRMMAEILREKKAEKVDASRRPLLLAGKVFIHISLNWKYRYTGLSFREFLRERTVVHLRQWFGKSQEIQHTPSDYFKAGPASLDSASRK